MPGLNDEIDSIDTEDCNVMEAELSILLQSEDDCTAYSGSTTTNITAKLIEAATRNLHYSQSRKAIQSTTPVAVHEARLEKDFPHVRDNRNNTEEDNDEDSAVVIHNERDRGVVDYNNCIETLSHHEQVELRRSIASNEKKKFVESAKRLSIQLGAYHTIIDENEQYRREIHQIQQDKDELEKSIVDMKLQLAQYQERDDYQRLRIARLELDLKKARAENHQLQEQVGFPVNKGRSNRRLSKSLSGLESPSKQVYDSELSGQQQQQRPIRHKSWLFGKDSLSSSILYPFLSFRRDTPDQQAVEKSEEALPKDSDVIPVSNSNEVYSEKDEGDLVRYNPSTIQSSGVIAIEDALLDSCNNLSIGSGGEGDSVTSSTASKSTALEFQPAKPQLQKKLSLRGVDVNLTSSMQEKIRKTETNPIQKAASLRGRGNKGNATSSGFLAFC